MRLFCVIVIRLKLLEQNLLSFFGSRSLIFKTTARPAVIYYTTTVYATKGWGIGSQ